MFELNGSRDGNTTEMKGQHLREDWKGDLVWVKICESEVSAGLLCKDF